MRNQRVFGFLLAIALSPVVVATAAHAQEETASLSREESVTVEVAATISAINRETREIELSDGLGNSRTLVAGPRVQRFDELQVGDQVHAEIQVSLLAEVRAPTAEELADPASVSRGVVRASGDSAIAGSVAESLTAVVTVVGLNLLSETITVFTPDNNLVDVQAASLDNLKQLRLGDTIVVTYTESLAVSVQKVGSAGE